jgi:hypothetical protein
MTCPVECERVGRQTRSAELNRAPRRQRSVADFMAFASDKEYLAGVEHRTAALEDSRLLPLVEAESI